MSLRKRAAKSLIARRAFLSLTFIQATLHACIPACDSTFSKFNRITVYFYKSQLSRCTFPRMKNARPCDFCLRFVRAIARFQRKFSVNHAKSAYFQRKSRKVSVNSAQIQECQHIRIKFYAFILQNHTSLCISALYTSHQTFLCYSYYKEAEYYINHSIHRHKAKPYGQSVQILHLHNPIRLINLFRSTHTYFGLYILPHFSPI